MPAIDIQVLEGVFSPGEKARIISGVTSAFAEVAGHTLGAADARAMRARR
ncbi:tautomerase family protein [Pseudooceanicola sp. HF7]|nr:tautomerase family protein [Pseudooceanicola sp. HF7]